MNIEKYGFNPIIIKEETPWIPARITSVHRQRFEIMCEKGMRLAHIKAGEFYQGKQNYPTTGDFVLIDYQENGESRIIKTLSRKSYFSRLDPSSSGQKEQVIAANFDYVFIMQSMNQDFNLKRLERYLTLGWQSGAIPVVILTKLDMVEDELPYIRAVEKLAVGTSVIPISNISSQGFEHLNDYLKPGKTIVLLGSSGVGKSTFVNTLAGHDIMPTSDIRDKDDKGKHTTTHRQLIMLDSGVMIIDTPGMRELGMWDVTEGINQSFADVEQYIGRCKFRNCNHQNEPGCAVNQAIYNGELTMERWESYIKIHLEARYSDDKIGYLKQKEKFLKDISQFRKRDKVIQYQHKECTDSFTCQVCGVVVTPDGAGTKHRNHCPKCLSSIHVDRHPGDRASLCKGIMDPIGVWVRNNGEWAIIHRCQKCGELNSNRIAADDDMKLLVSIATKPLEHIPIALNKITD